MGTADERAGLAGVRVLELGELVSAPYATKLLADLGADVIKVEPPDGDPARYRGPFAADVDPDRSGLYLALNTSKRSVVVDRSAAGEDRLAPLVADADIVISNLGPERLADLGLDLERLVADRPELVVCSITPFGLTGPHAGYRATELTVAHAGGWAYQCPGASDRDDLPPLKVFGHQTDFHAGLAAAMAALAAYNRAVTTGVGELIDLSSVAHTVGMLEAALIAASYMGENPSRLGSRLLNPWGIYRCRDGLIFVVTVEQDQWERLVELMDRPSWTELGLFDTVELRFENEDLLAVYLQEWIEQFTVTELWHRGQAARICFAPVLTMADLATQEHLAARGFLVEVDHPAAGPVTHLGPPFRPSTPLGGPPRPAPTLDGAATPSFGPARTPGSLSTATGVGPASDDRPLAGVRVLDLSWVWAGPYAGLHLAFLGAEVIKIESSLRPGLGRRLALHPPDVEPSLNTSSYFNQWEQAKLSCELDLTDPEAIGLVKELAGRCDVVLENFATGVMDRLGLGYDALREINPSIIVASISGYGSDGPLADFMGYGPTTGPLSGLSALTGYEGGPPEELGISFGDPAAGLMAAFAITAALTARAFDGTGCYLDVALWEATASNAVEGWMAHAMGAKPLERMGNRDPHLAPHGCYRCGPDPSDPDGDLEAGYWVTIACVTDEDWVSVAAEIDPALTDDPRFATAADRKRNEDALDDLVTGWTAGLDRWTVTDRLQARGVAAFPSMSPQDLLADEHLWARGLFERLDHAEVGRRIHVGVPWRMQRSPNGVPAPAPLLGQHTDAVLGTLLGRTPDEIQQLRDRGLTT